MDEALKKRLEITKSRLAEIDVQLLEENVTKDIKLFRDLSKERANLEPIVEAYDKYLKLESDLTDSEVMIGDADPEISAFGREEHKRILSELEHTDEEFKILLLPKDPNDDKNIIVEIRGAAGGDEGNIFAGDLFRMYVRYAETQGWKYQILDENPSEAGGFAFVSFMIKGDGV